MLGVVGSNLTIFKLEPTTPNMWQHIATRWPNAHNMLRLTMLGYVALACCDRLAGALERFSFECRKVIGFAFTTLRDWFKKPSLHFFIQSGVKPKPIVIHSYAFSRTLRQLYVITSRFDWFT